MHLWLHLCSVHESDSCITSCQQSWWYNLRLHCVMIWCHAMSYHVIPCHTRFFDVPLHHSAAVSFNPFLHFFCGLLLPKDDSRTSKTVDEDNGAIMRNLTFLAQLHQLRCSVMFCVNSCNCHLRCDWTVFLPTWIHDSFSRDTKCEGEFKTTESSRWYVWI